MKLETVVTAINDKKNKASASKTYVIQDVCQFTGVANKADAVMITKQAFIMAGRSLVMKEWLKSHPLPEGTKATDWLKTAKIEDITASMWPKAEDVLAAARVKAVKEKKQKAVMSKEDILANAAAMLGMTVAELLAKSAPVAAPEVEDEEAVEDEDEEA